MQRGSRSFSRGDRRDGYTRAGVRAIGAHAPEKGSSLFSAAGASAEFRVTAAALRLRPKICLGTTWNNASPRRSRSISPFTTIRVSHTAALSLRLRRRLTSSCRSHRPIFMLLVPVLRRRYLHPK